MSRKYQPVMAAVSRTGITGDTYWTLVLACGHTQTAVRSRRGWRLRTKPAPDRVVCRECSRQKGTVTP